MTVSVDEIGPKEAWAHLKADKDAVLVDVRTKEEWSFVGIPDLSSIDKEAAFVEWATLPGMQPNHAFIEGMMTRLGGAAPSKILFLCRSGARSMAAAQKAAGAFEKAGRSVRLINVAEGFEGDLDGSGHRGTTNGWKARGLPWHQS
ncbi:MAG: rhodanese-like domain-containing protein [Rhodobacteraceae bacterium]|nr:rhodanese-like domain-containing protein [Paracoccaceae bacterium]